jgi:hypothetical protein
MGTGISTEELKSLADEYEKLREMVMEVQDRLEWTIKACSVDRDRKLYWQTNQI